MLNKLLVVLFGLTLSSTLTAAEFMDADWAKQACDAWNESETLTSKLMQTSSDDTSYSWIKNDAGRGYKLIQIYRSNCGKESRIQLNIGEVDGKAMCTYGGVPDGKEMKKSVDYLMHASDKNWTCMGSGKCGVMGSMMTRKLKFKGPKMEAMQVMSPFGSFLRLTGTIAGEKNECKG